YRPVRGPTGLCVTAHSTATRGDRSLPSLSAQPTREPRQGLPAERRQALRSATTSTWSPDQPKAHRDGSAAAGAAGARDSGFSNNVRDLNSHPSGVFSYTSS